MPSNLANFFRLQPDYEWQHQSRVNVDVANRKSQNWRGHGDVVIQGKVRSEATITVNATGCIHLEIEPGKNVKFKFKGNVDVCISEKLASQIIIDNKANKGKIKTPLAPIFTVDEFVFDPKFPYALEDESPRL